MQFRQKHRRIFGRIGLIILLIIPSVSATIWDPFSLDSLEDIFVTYINWKRNVNGSGANLSVDDYKTSEEGLEWIKPENIFDVDDEDVETDLNTYVDIGGDVMTDKLEVPDINITGIAYLNTINCSNNTCKIKGNVNINNNLSVAESVTFGRITVASGEHSFAQGVDTDALGLRSVAMGFQSAASGVNSMAVNMQTIASGASSFASGDATDSSATASTAMGHTTTASGGRSFAVGTHTVASGWTSVALGSNTLADGSVSFATGYEAVASGIGAFALGGYYDIDAETGGFLTGPTASGLSSFAIGNNFTNNIDSSFAVGYDDITLLVRDGNVLIDGDLNITENITLENNELISNSVDKIIRLEGIDPTGPWTLGFEIDYDFAWPTIRGTSSLSAAKIIFVDGQIRFKDNQVMAWGDISDSTIRWYTTGPDHLNIRIATRATATDSGNIVITDTSNFPTANYPIMFDPTLSIVANGTNINNRIMIQHTGDDGGDYGLIKTFSGDLVLNASSGQTKIKGDLNVTGNISADNVFLLADISAHTNATIPVAVAGRWYNVTFSEEAAAPVKDILHTHNDETNDTFTAVHPIGTYKTKYTITFEDSNPTPGTHVLARLIKNGVEIPGSLLEEDSTRQYAEFTIGNGPHVDLVAGDEIKVQFTASATSVSMKSHLTYGTHRDSATFKMVRIR